MTRGFLFTTLALVALLQIGCSTASAGRAGDIDPPWPGGLGHTDDDPETRQVTVIIALSSVVPAGIVGHAGVAVDDQYWDFGPDRVGRFQRLKSLRSPAGPWWDDPAQDWRTDRSLADVLADANERIHPPGSLVVLMRARVTDAQADRLAGFWQGVYRRMRAGESVYAMSGRQCSSMVGWGIDAALDGGTARDAGAVADGAMPPQFKFMTPTRLYESLREQMVHTAGPRAGEPADLEVWQLGPDGLHPYHRPAVWRALQCRELSRTRLGIERVKHLPVALAEAVAGG